MMTTPAKSPATVCVAVGAQSTPFWNSYVSEVLAHSGHSFTVHTSPQPPRDHRVVVLTHPIAAEHEPLWRAWVNDGGSLLITGEVGALADLAGASPTNAFGSALVSVVDSPVWAQMPPTQIRALAGRELTTAAGVQVLATVNSDTAVIALREVGDGVVITFGVDLWYTIARIQQGYEVREDGIPSRDGAAPINDGVLKAEDGLALDIDEDRMLPAGAAPMAADFVHVLPPHSAVPIVQQPHADWWRSLFLQALWHAGSAARQTSAWLDYWPAGIDAVAHMSHDSDGNDNEQTISALAAFAEADVRVTWHHVFPGGYTDEVIAQIASDGHEQALHYNAMGDADIARWGWQYFRAQYAWAQAITGCEDIVSNKNHYTRWEGWTEFYDWCERVGMKIDSSRGASKQGLAGFPFGTAHVSFPLRAEGSATAFHDVINLPLHTQDLAFASDAAVRDVILDGAQAQHGVAHFLFHAPHLHLRPATRQACLDVSAAATRRGMPWWTAREINNWERLRRGVTVSVTRSGSSAVVTVDAAEPVRGASILLSDLSLSSRDASVELATVRRHGREFIDMRVDIPRGRSEWVLEAANATAGVGGL